MPNNTFIEDDSYDDLIINFNQNLKDIELFYKNEMKELQTVYNETYDNIFEDYKKLAVNLKESIVKDKDELNHKLEIYNRVYPIIEEEYNTNKKNLHDKFTEDEIIISDINKIKQDNKIEDTINEYNNEIVITKNNFINNQEELNKNIKKIDNDTNELLTELDNSLELKINELKKNHEENLKKTNEKYNKLLEVQELKYLEDMGNIREEFNRDSITIELLTKEHNRIKEEFSKKIDKELAEISINVENEITNMYNSKINFINDEIEKSKINYDNSKINIVNLINSLLLTSSKNDNIEQDLKDDIKKISNLIEDNKINQKKFLDSNKKNISDYHNKFEKFKSDKLLESKEFDNIVDYEINQEVNKIIEEENKFYNKNKSELEKEVKKLAEEHHNSLIVVQEDIYEIEAELVNSESTLMDTNNKLKKSKDLLKNINDHQLDELIKQEMEEEHKVLLENKNNFVKNYENYTKNKFNEFDTNKNNDIKELDNIKDNYISKDEELSNSIIELEGNKSIKTKKLNDINSEKNILSKKIDELNQEYMNNKDNLNLIADELVKEIMEDYQDEHNKKVNEINNKYEKDLENINNKKINLNNEIKEINIGNKNELIDSMELKMSEINNNKKLLEEKKEELSVNLNDIENNKKEEYDQLINIKSVTNESLTADNLKQLQEFESEKSNYYSALSTGELSQEKTVEILYKITQLEENIENLKKLNESLSKNFIIDIDTLDIKYENLKEDTNINYNKDIEELESIISLDNIKYLQLKEDIQKIDDDNKLLESIEMDIKKIEEESENIKINLNSELDKINKNFDVLKNATYEEEYKKLENKIEIDNKKLLNDNIKDLNLKDIEYYKITESLKVINKDIDLLKDKINESQTFLNSYDKNKEKINDKYNKLKEEEIKLSKKNLEINDMTYNEQYNILLEKTKNKFSETNISKQIDQYENELLDKTKELFKLKNELQTSNNKLQDINSYEPTKDLNNNIIFLDAVHTEKINNINKSVEDMKRDKLNIYLENIDTKYLELEKNHEIENKVMFDKINEFDNNIQKYTDELEDKKNLLNKLNKNHENDENIKEDDIEKKKIDIETKFNNEQNRLNKELEDLNKKIQNDISKNIEISTSKKIKEFEIQHDMIKKVSDIERAINEINKSNKENEDILNKSNSIEKSEIESKQNVEKGLINNKYNKEKEEITEDYNNKKNEIIKMYDDKIKNKKIELEKLVKENDDTIKNINTNHDNNLSIINTSYETELKNTIVKLKLDYDGMLKRIEDKFVLDNSKYFVNYDKELIELEEGNKEEMNKMNATKELELEKNYKYFEEEKQKIENKLTTDLNTAKNNIKISLKEKKN